MIDLDIRSASADDKEEEDSQHPENRNFQLAVKDSI